MSDKARDILTALLESNAEMWPTKINIICNNVQECEAYRMHMMEEVTQHGYPYYIKMRRHFPKIFKLLDEYSNILIRGDKK